MVELARKESKVHRAQLVRKVQQAQQAQLVLLAQQVPPARLAQLARLAQRVLKVQLVRLVRKVQLVQQAQLVLLGQLVLRAQQVLLAQLVRWVRRAQLAVGIKTLTVVSINTQLAISKATSSRTTDRHSSQDLLVIHSARLEYRPATGTSWHLSVRQAQLERLVHLVQLGSLD